MIKSAKNSHKGAALTAVLILLAIGTVLIATFFGPIRSLVGIGSKERKRSTLELRAEGAMELALADLTQRTGSKDFTSFVPPGETGYGQPTDDCEANEPTWNCKVGLVPWPGRDCSTHNSTTCLPRFTQTSSGITFSVWYYPNQLNAPSTAFRLVPQRSISIDQMALAALTAGELEGEITKEKPKEEEPPKWEPEPVGTEPSASQYNPKPQTTVIPTPTPEPWTGDPTAYDRKPKSFLVIVEAVQNATGESWKMEALLETGFTNMSEITSGIMAPSENPFTQANGFVILPSEWTGRVHFGTFPPDHLVRFVEGDGSPHVFHDLVTFGNGPNEDGFPFNRDGAPDLAEGARMDFKGGLKFPDNSVGEDLDEKYAQTLSADLDQLVISAESGKNDVCLKFKTLNSGVGQIWKYICNTTAAGEKPGLVFDPFQRYKRTETEFEVDDLEAPPATVYNIDDYDMVVCQNADGTDCNLHVKGIYKGALTMAGNNIFLEGDVAAYDQSIDPDNPSTDMLGLVAEKDIVIPNRIPQHHLYKTSGHFHPHAPWLCGYGHPPSTSPGDVAYAGCNGPDSPYNGIINFLSPTEDRNVALANLPENPILEPWNGPGSNLEDIGWHWFWGWSSGKPSFHMENDMDVIRATNKTNGLEIDATLLAAGGSLNVEGLNEWEINPDTGFAMYAADNKAYKWPGLPNCADPDADDYYICNNTDEGKYEAKADAPACFIPGNAGYSSPGFWECDYTQEALLGAGNGVLQIHGGLQTLDYSRTQYTQDFGNWSRRVNVGFDRKMILKDPRFQSIHPPGYPDSNEAKVSVRYIKSYPGK